MAFNMTAEKKTWKKNTKIHPVLLGRFAKNLKILRTKKGWPQEVFAPMAKITAPYVSLLESMQRTPSLEIVERCARALGVDPAVLLAEPKEES